MAEKQSVESRKDRRHLTEKRIVLIFLVLVVIGVVGFFTSRGSWAFYYLSHLGAIGVLGLLGALAGLVAGKKGYDFMKAFWFGFTAPIVLGILAVLGMRYSGDEGTPFYCGGSISLAVAILIIIGYSLTRRRKNIAAPTTDGAG